MLRTPIVLLLVATSAGCRRNPEESAVSGPAPPPAAALALGGRNLSLDQSLKQLEHELSVALGSGMDSNGETHILTAEAITDRLLETQMPFAWLTTTSYSVESHVRQIQALADRVVAELRSGEDRATVMDDARELRKKVISLRRALASGGGNPPKSLDSLLAATKNDSLKVTDAGE